MLYTLLLSRSACFFIFASFWRRSYSAKDIVAPAGFYKRSAYFFALASFYMRSYSASDMPPPPPIGAGLLVDVAYATDDF